MPRNPAVKTSFDLAATRVWGRLVRRYPQTQRTISDVKHHWYWKGTPWVQRDRFGKLPEVRRNH